MGSSSSGSTGIDVPVFDNSRQVARILYRLRSYWTIGRAALRRGVSARSMVLTKFPYWLGDAALPSSLSVELTDACNLKCVYCNNPGLAYPRTFMTDEVLDAIVASLGRTRIPRVRVGGGEATLHPKFDVFSRGLSRHTPFLSVVTNAQWRDTAIVDALLRHYQLIEVSVDAGGAAQYASSRVGGSYEALVNNVILLSQQKKLVGSKAIVNIRLMIRPSTRAQQAREARFWTPYCDSIMPQYVMKHREVASQGDVFHSPHVMSGAYPRCTLPFKDLQIRANGDVPLCQVTGSTNDPRRRVMIGNIKTHSLHELWHSAALKTIRAAHRRRRNEDMRVCRGCSGR